MTVIAPHPDDETLGLGATIATLCAAGVDVQVVSASDGGASYPGLGTVARIELEERAQGRSFAGRSTVWAPENRSALGLPDGELSQHEDFMAAGELPRC